MKLYNATNLIIINKDNQILLTKRSKKDEDGYDNTWCIPGGWAEIGENFEDAIHREIQEELWCKIKWCKYFKSYFMNLNENLSSRVVYYYWEITGKIIINHESSEYKRFYLKNPELLNLDFAFNQKDVLKDFLDSYNKLP